MTIDIEKLEALAKAASVRTSDVEADEGAMFAFECALNPAAVLELIAEIETLRNQVRLAGVSAEMTVHQAVGRAATESLLVMHERDQLKAENERLQRFETAYKEFSEKTDWVRPNAAAHELGMHVADVIRKRCDDLTSHNQAQADEILRLRGRAVDGTNTGHGHVFPRPDGAIAKCGGPGLCRECSSDLARKEQRP